jgi:hypothetical protein
LAVAGDQSACAISLVAGVGHGARVAVVAVGEVVLEMAAAGAVTGVVGAGVIVVTDDGVANADSLLAIVGRGAWVAVFALTLVEEIVGAPRLPIAEVFGAVVPVVTEGYEETLFFVGFISEAVAIVIDAVAGLGGRNIGIAFGQTLVRANPLASTGAEVIGDVARSPKAEADRFTGAWAGSGFGHTLQCVDAIDCDCRQT